MMKEAAAPIRYLELAKSALADSVGKMSQRKSGYQSSMERLKQAKFFLKHYTLPQQSHLFKQD